MKSPISFLGPRPKQGAAEHFRVTQITFRLIERRAVDSMKAAPGRGSGRIDDSLDHDGRRNTLTIPDRIRDGMIDALWLANAGGEACRQHLLVSLAPPPYVPPVGPATHHRSRPKPLGVVHVPTNPDAFRIFVIGPMNLRPDGNGELSSNTQRLVASLRAILAADGDGTVVIEAPEALRGGADIPSEVFGRIDIADLIIADLTPREPGQIDPSANVIYELALADALGLPTFLVRNSTSFDGPPPPIPFYFSQMQVHLFDFDDIAAIDHAIGDTIRECVAGTSLSGVDPTRNPFSSFYQAPIVNVSAAVGVAVSYYVNFVRALTAPGGAFDLEAHAGRKFDQLVVVLPQTVNRIEDVTASIERDVAASAALQAGAGVRTRLVRDQILADGSKVQRQAHLIGNVVVDIPRTITSLRQSPRIRRLGRKAHSPTLRQVTTSDATRERLEAAMIQAFGNSLNVLLDEAPDSERLPVVVVRPEAALATIVAHFRA